MPPRTHNRSSDFIPIYRRKLTVEEIAWLDDAAEAGKCSASTVITKIVKDVIGEERAAR